MISVIISIYNRLDNLYLILLALSKQTYTDFEIIVSEDRNAAETISFINEMRREFNFKIRHVNQEDDGFRKTRILNKAVVAAKGEYLVFLDGDCIPHFRLLESYSRRLSPDTVCLGRRCYLDEKITRELLETKDLGRINLFSLLLHARHLDRAFYMPWMGIGKPKRKVIGCNWAIPRQTILNINGYDEDYTQAGCGEDLDVDWRLRKLTSIKFKNIKHEVITYHLYHKPNYSDDATKWGYALMAEKIKTGLFFCKNGIEKI
ncbi:glycosyltransferase [Dysgonomonas sp. OttesenSCG-928-M03]|nr:glycosyltransferase [Dysgonomonas sp. OttesenSCG-928-M03]